jgi:hypothetical protein
MTSAELREIRQAFGLSASAMGRALGYSGPKANVAVHVADSSATPGRPRSKSSQRCMPATAFLKNGRSDSPAGELKKFTPRSIALGEEHESNAGGHEN